MDSWSDRVYNYTASHAIGIIKVSEWLGAALAHLDAVSNYT